MTKPLVRDELWGRIEPLLPPTPRRRVGYPGRKPIPPRQLRFESVPLRGILVLLAHRMRRVDCRRCGATVEMAPWCDGKNQLTTTYRWFLASWARRLSRGEVGALFRTSWERARRAVEHAVEWGLAHRTRTG